MNRRRHARRGALLLVCAAALASALPASAAGDQMRSKQWAPDQIKASDAWTASRGAGVTIAVVDTGIDLDHPDLKSKVSAAYTCIGSCGAGGRDDNGHGSHVAGIAAAATGNGTGIAGVAPDARLMAVKVLDKTGSGTCADVAMGIRWAADHGAGVVNLSLGPDVTIDLGVLGLAGCLNALQQAISNAWDKGAVIVAAAGNDALPASFYTGTQDLEVVGATGPGDTLAWYSTGGLGVDVYAPGGDDGKSDPKKCTTSTCVLSTWRGANPGENAYAIAEGTSMATPHVSGVAALLRAQRRTNRQAVDQINNTADTTSDGFPRVNAARAVGAREGSGGDPSPGPSHIATSAPGAPRQTPGGGGGGSPPPSTPTQGSSDAPAAGPGGTAGPSDHSPAGEPERPSSLPTGLVLAVSAGLGVPLALRWAVLRLLRKRASPGTPS